MVKGRCSLLGTWVLLAGLAASQEPASKPSTQAQRVEVATLGATTRAPSKQEAADLGLKREVRARGQLVTEVVKDGGVAGAGIEPGDVLVQLDAVELYSQDDITDFLGVSKPGQKVQAVVLRAKTAKEETVAVSLGRQQLPAPENPVMAWEFASLGQLGDALARARKEKKRVLVGLSGAET